MDKIALINVNKNGGSSQASSSIIKNNYTKHKDTLLQQIEKIEQQANGELQVAPLDGTIDHE